MLLTTRPLCSTGPVDAPIAVLEQSPWLQTDQLTVSFIGLSILIVKPPPATSLFNARILLTAEVEFNGFVGLGPVGVVPNVTEIESELVSRNQVTFSRKWR